MYLINLVRSLDFFGVGSSTILRLQRSIRHFLKFQR